MEQKFTHLRLKMLLWIFLGALGAWLAVLLVWKVVFLTLLHDPLQRFIVWASMNWQGRTLEEAQEVYSLYLVANRPLFMGLAMGAIMLLACYIALGRFSKYLNQISGAVRQVFSETGAPDLPDELSPMQADLEGIQRALSSRRETAMAGTQRRSDLVAFLAHDLKTPLTSVLGYLQLLDSHPDLPAEQRAKYVGIALEKAQRLEKLIGEFFDITRIDLQHNEADRVAVQLNLLLCQMVDEFYPLFQEKNLSCVAAIDCKLEVLGNPGYLARVLDNVLRNAVSYSTPGSTIHITLSYTPGWAQVDISNQGLEIPEGELSNIFNKFYRLDEARQTRTGGAGLGLAIAKEIVELHGGTISASTNSDRTTFTIRLPAREL